MTFSLFTSDSLAAKISRWVLVVGCLVSSSVADAEDPTPGKQVEQVLERRDGLQLGYHLYLPEDYDSSKTYPFILFLHGRGESNGPLSLVKKWGPPRVVESGTKLPFIIASPQCPKSPARWNDEVRLQLLTDLVGHLETGYAIDKTRMYLTGLSMGGEGVWTLAARLPNKFAAMAPVCGATDPKLAKAYLDLPIWIWHGTEDTAVPFTESTEILEAIKALGGDKAKLTSLEHVGHNSWSAAYGSPQLYSWFQKHKRSK